MVAGSVDEQADEQGIAHLVEHVTFLGSRKREGLLGTGARSNAYTDFHHTVFHVHSPLVNTSSGDPTPMLPQVASPSSCSTGASVLSASNVVARGCQQVQQLRWLWVRARYPLLDESVSDRVAPSEAAAL